MASTTRQIENLAQMIYPYLFQAQDALGIADEDMPVIIAHIHFDLQDRLERPQKPTLVLITNNRQIAPKVDG